VNDAICVYCFAPVEWGRTVKGVRVQLNPRGVDAGAKPDWIVIPNGDGLLARRPFVGEVVAADADLRTSHWITCPAR